MRSADFLNLFIDLNRRQMFGFPRRPGSWGDDAAGSFQHRDAKMVRRRSGETFIYLSSSSSSPPTTSTEHVVVRMRPVHANHEITAGLVESMRSVPDGRGTGGVAVGMAMFPTRKPPAD
jgi:hypothetical protein